MPEPFRKVSLALVVKDLGAVQTRGPVGRMVRSNTRRFQEGSAELRTAVGRRLASSARLPIGHTARTFRPSTFRPTVSHASLQNTMTAGAPPDVTADAAADAVTETPGHPEAVKQSAILSA